MAQGSSEFDALARQYWGMWGDAMRTASPSSAPDAGLHGMRDAFAAWTQTAGGAQGGIDEALSHFNRQSGDWLAQMQQLAAQFAGRPHDAQDVADAWRRMVGGNAFHGLFQGMRGPGLQDIGQWSEAAGPWLQGLRGQVSGLLGMPAFGFTREHQERLQSVAQSQLQWQDALTAYNALMAGVSQDAHARFATKLAEREQPGRQLTSVRALFDLWVDAAEEAYADAALSPGYRAAYGALVNAQMRLRADAQAIAEQTAQLAGMPSRSELDGAHRKIAELERQLRRVQRAGKDEAVAATTTAPERMSPSKPATTSTTRASRPAAAKRAPAKKPAGAVRAPAKKSATASRTSTRTSAKTAGTTSKSPRPRRPAKPAKPTTRKR
jgi:class III poly(R)-hydroxyalkanoic acid synthase PhaE subunit